MSEPQQSSNTQEAKAHVHGPDCDHEHEQHQHVHGPHCNHGHHHHAQQPYIRNTPKIGRNDPCQCGSGQKFKKCCGK